MMRVTLQHLRTIPSYSAKPGFCMRDSRAWAKKHGIDWSVFLRDGVAIERMEAIDDAFAQALVKWTRECEARKQVSHGW